MKFLGRPINRNEIFGVEKVIFDFAGIFPNENFPNWKILTTVAYMSLMLIFQVLISTRISVIEWTTLAFLFQIDYLIVNRGNIINVASALPEFVGCLEAVLKMLFLLYSSRRLKSIISELCLEWDKSLYSGFLFNNNLTKKTLQLLQKQIPNGYLSIEKWKNLHHNWQLGFRSLRYSHRLHI